MSDLTVMKAKRFAEIYYRLMDGSRAQLFGLYKTEAVYVYNGNAVLGRPDIIRFLERDIPMTKHEMQTLDVQEIGGSSSSVIMSITGNVTTGFKNECRYMHTLTLERDQAQPERQVYLIMSDFFRTHE